MAKILIIDDSAIVREHLQALLESNKHEVTAAENGHVGLVKLKEPNSYQIILCDINMPKIDGLTMLETAQKEKLLEGKYIFMLTTETSIEMKARGKGLGVVGWITKPYVEKVVISVLDRVIEGKTHHQKHN
jgi:two-component system, chemotaxis family, chemotaxis protein CheY